MRSTKRQNLARFGLKTLLKFGKLLFTKWFSGLQVPFINQPCHKITALWPAGYHELVEAKWLDDQPCAYHAEFNMSGGCAWHVCCKATAVANGTHHTGATMQSAHLVPEEPQHCCLARTMHPGVNTPIKAVAPGEAVAS
jgi:hypothetical protein